MADLVPYSQAATTSLVSTLQNSDIMALAREDNQSDTGYQSKVTRVDTIAKKVVKETDYSDLATTSKNIIGAINEVNTKASQFDNLTATASGSIATFNNGGDGIPLKSCVCEINPVQAYSPNPPSPSNPRAISGFSSLVIADNQKNFLDSSIKNTNPQYCVFGGVLGSNVPNGTFILASGTYKFSCSESINGIEVRNYKGDIIASASYSTTLTFTVPFNQSILIVLNKSGASWNSYTYQVERGNQATTYEPYNGNTTTLNLGQTVYFGDADIDGNGTSEGDRVDLSTLNWISVSDGLFFANDDLGEYRGVGKIGLCEIYDVVDNVSGASAVPSTDKIICGIDNTSNHRLYIRDRAYSDETSFKNSMVGKYLVYKKATPQAITFTGAKPTTIHGTNNIYHNGNGDIDLTYFTENAEPIAEVVKAFI